MYLQDGCFERNGKVYDLLLTNEDGQELPVKEDDLEDLAEVLKDRDLVQDKNACDTCDMCSYCDRCNDCERLDGYDIAEWIKDNIQDMAEVVKDTVIEYLKGAPGDDIEGTLIDALTNFFKDNACILRPHL